MAAGDRNQERKFREWLGKCHSQLDKSLHFGHLADPSVQVTSRCHHGLVVILCSIKSRVRHGDNAVAIVHTEVQLVHAAAVLQFTVYMTICAVYTQQPCFVIHL